MDLVQPRSWADALALRAERPDLLPLAGGTDVMVDLNFGRSRPTGLLDLTRITEIGSWSVDDGVLRIGAGVTYARIQAELAGLAPGLAMAARTVGSPQIRNRGTVAGNLGSASPAGDAHPPLLAVGASVEVESVRGSRSVPVADFFTGVTRHTLDPDELIAAVHVPVTRGPQQFAKIGTRNAMVIAVASFGLAIDPDARSVGTGIGSAGPTPCAAPAAEEHLAGELDWDGHAPLDPVALRRFGELVAEAAAPIDDVRGSAAYRRHALAVLAARTATWAWDEYSSREAS